MGVTKIRGMTRRGREIGPVEKDPFKRMLREVRWG